MHPRLRMSAIKTRPEPHHHIFYTCEQAILRNLKVEAVLPHLLEKKVVPESDTSLYTGKPRNGMKILIGYLRNRSFETFLDFVECILLAQGDDPSKAQSVTVVDSIVRAMREYDQRNDTHWVDDVVAIQQKYVKTTEESSQECISASDGEELPLKPAAGAYRTDRLSMPEDLDYIEEPHQESFRSDGGRFEHFKRLGFSLVVPPFAVPEGEEIKLRVGLCCCGPFSINEKYLLASDFAVIVADSEFSKPVEVFMDHCLILPEYRKCSEVLILKADHRKVTKDGLYTFDRFTIPDIDPSYPKLSFAAEEFCILCSVLESPVGDDSFVSTSSSGSVDDYVDESNPSSTASSCTGSPPPTLSMFGIPSASSDSEMETSFPATRKRKSESLKDGEPPGDISRRISSTKARNKRANMKRRTHQLAQSPAKRHCTTEYAALLFWSKNKIFEDCDDLYQFMIFICTNCPVALEMWTTRAAEKLKVHKLDLVRVLIPIVICKKVIKILISDVCAGWTVKPDKTPTVSEREYRFCYMNSNELRERIEQKTCPPRIVYCAECANTTSRLFSCNVRLEGVTLMAETDCDMFILASIERPVRVSYVGTRPVVTHHGYHPNYSRVDYHAADYPPAYHHGYLPAHHHGYEGFNPPPMMSRGYPQYPPPHAPGPGPYYGYPPYQTPLPYPSHDPPPNAMATKASCQENIPPNAMVTKANTTSCQGNLPPNAMATKANTTSCQGNLPPNAMQQPSSWKHPESVPSSLGHLELSQEYPDSPLPSLETHIPLSLSLSQECDAQMPTRSSEIQQESPIVSKLRDLTLNGEQDLPVVSKLRDLSLDSNNNLPLLQQDKSVRNDIQF